MYPHCPNSIAGSVGGARINMFREAGASTSLAPSRAAAEPLDFLLAEATQVLENMKWVNPGAPDN